MKRTLLICVLVATAFGWAFILLDQTSAFAASGPANQQQPKVTRMTLRPAAEPRPALKYRLLPGFIEKRPGDAAVVYNRIWAEDEDVLRPYLRKNGEEVYSWTEMPLDNLPSKKVEEFVRKTSGVYRDCAWAARLESCDWSHPIRDEDPMQVLLPDIQQIRQPARILAIRARWQTAQGQFGDAVDTLRAGYAMGRNVAKDPFLVSSLVGMAICNVMSDQIETMVQQPGCPNLYWALTDLPDPIVDTRAAFEGEYEFLYLMVPELRELDMTNHSADYWRGVIDRMAKRMGAVGGAMGPEEQARAMTAALAIKGYPQARRALIAQGRSAEEVDAMPVAQVVVMYTLETYNELRDDTFKWFSLPWWQAKPGMDRVERRLREESRRREIVPIAGMLLPAVQAVKFAEARTARQIALSRTIEALRLYAASHDGRLPEKLSDIAEVPIPIDPMTGKPIECKIDGGVAVLEVFHDPEMKTPARRIEIRMAK